MHIKKVLIRGQFITKNGTIGPLKRTLNIYNDLEQCIRTIYKTDNIQEVPPVVYTFLRSNNAVNDGLKIHYPFISLQAYTQGYSYNMLVIYFRCSEDVNEEHEYIMYKFILSRKLKTLIDIDVQIL